MNQTTTKSPPSHVLPVGLYVGIGAALLVLTLVTVLVARFDFGGWNVAIALGIAAVKGSLVVLYFMHLRYDQPLFGLVFVLSILFLAVFIVFTMFDTQSRAGLYEISGEPIRPHAVIYDDVGEPLPMAERDLGLAEGKLASAEAEDEIPFEMLHGYGPIKEVIEVGPVDTAWALRGQPIFETKCATCHKLDERYTGPPLRSAAAYRSPTFIMNQILDPVQNVANHPDMQNMLKTYYTIMTNQNVSEEEARTLVEYLRYESGRPPQTQAD